MSTAVAAASVKKEQPSVQAACAIRLHGIEKSYPRGGERVQILDGINLDIAEGSFEALMGPSGSGKSTLLNILAGFDRPSAGEVTVAGTRLERLSDSALTKWRAGTIGFIFQTFNLMPVLTALENVELPLTLINLPRAERRRRAETALRVVGLEDRMHHFPRQLSGGQEQRVAIARAIVNDPSLILADEPTGDLDRQSAAVVLELLEKLNREFKKTIVMVTHDPVAGERASVIRRLEKGVLQ